MPGGGLELRARTASLALRAASAQADRTKAFATIRRGERLLWSRSGFGGIAQARKAAEDAALELGR